jgi:oxygen-dependent protoporphyrinogen oxidase
MTTRRYAVVGGGITGLAAAWELTRLAPGDEVVVYEPGALGGKLRTTAFAGRLVDEGADAFLARVPWGRELCDELDLGAELVSPATPVAYVASGAELHRLPAGLVLGVPTDAGALRDSPLVGADAVARVEAEPTLPGAPLGAADDPSVGDLIRRRFGDDVLEHLVDPLLGGINAGDSDRLSVRAAAPQLAAAAERSASLVEGLLAASPPDDPAAPVFWALPGGMTDLVDALVAALAAAGVTFTAEAVAAVGDVAGDGVVLATPAAATATILEKAGAADAASVLRTLGHASPVLTTFAFRRGDIAHALDGSGFLVPRAEGRFLTACSFATTKWAHLGAADPGTVVLRASAGRYGDDRAIDLDDDAVAVRMLADLDDLLGLAGDPTAVRISRWPGGFPQYEPGHLDRVAAVEADVAARLPGVALAGAAYRGIGIPACIRQGRQAAAGLVVGPSS